MFNYHRAMLSAFSLFPVLLAATNCMGATPECDPTASVKAIAPFVDDQTFAVLHVDISRINVDPVFDMLSEILPETSAEDDLFREKMKLMQAKVVDAGVSSIYVVVGMSHIPNQPPLIIFPTSEEADIEMLRRVLPQQRGQKIERIHNAWCYLTADELDRLRTTDRVPRPELVAAFKAAGDTLAQLIIVPPKFSSRVIEEMMPELPEEMGGGPSTVLTEGLQWAAIGVNAPPNTSLKVVVQSKDKEAARALEKSWVSLVQFLSQYSKDKDSVRDFARAAALLSPKVSGNQLVVDLSVQDETIEALLAGLTPPLDAARARARRQASVNNLKQIALAMHNYHDVWKSFPAVGNTGASGNMLLSWRVHILPFVEHNQLYKQFRLNEPWDSEHNIKLIDKMPNVYRCPQSKHAREKGLSTYRVVSGKNTTFPGRTGVKLKDVTDGTSNTIMATEVDDDHAIAWTKPEGLPFDPKNPRRGLGGHFDQGFNAAWCDGSVRFLADSIDKEILRLLFIRNDGKPIPRD